MLAPPRLRAGKLLVDQRMYVETKYGQAFDVGDTLLAVEKACRAEFLGRVRGKVDAVKRIECLAVADDIGGECRAAKQGQHKRCDVSAQGHEKVSLYSSFLVIVCHTGRWCDAISLAASTYETKS